MGAEGVTGVVPLEVDESASLDALKFLTDLVENDLESVNHVIVERMQSPVSLIPLLGGHLIESGGKRLRPMLTLASAKAFGYRGDRHLKLAAAVEFIHTATLLHDDVIDQSSMRRGKVAAHVVWGNQPSVLVGDFLFSRAFQLMVECGNLRILEVLSNAAAVIAEGEVMQLSVANDTTATEATYLKVIEAKTAELFAAAAEVGALVAGHDGPEAAAMRAYGHNLGIAFQLVDDALDYTGSSDEMGKSVGDDFRDGKITLPIVLAVARGNDSERAFWRRTLEASMQDDADLTEAIRILRRREAIETTLEEARRYGELAHEALASVPRNSVTEALDGVVDFCIARTY
ncbi:MAG: polyprenyl synthetase family protein [Alphaproteobacteria bacterium]